MREINKIIQSRNKLISDLTLHSKREDEGGCGVVGAAASVKIKGKHFLKSCERMKNRGNGKGGGVAVVGLDHEQLKVTEPVLQNDYIIQIAFLDVSTREEIEKEYIFPNFDVDTHYMVDSIEDFTTIGLEVKPPDIYRYFCKIKESILISFMEKHDLTNREDAADEFIFQSSYRLNKEYYSSLGEKRAFVMSHGKNQLVFKLVGYADQAIRYYKLDECKAHIWIGHHRYPTKGSVTHPGGAHPFIGVNEALVHNGDFANYHSVSEYLAQRNYYPLFLTDTEVSVYLFDLYSRVYKYPLELVIEALAPTTERDYTLLDDKKQLICQEIQTVHANGSPDGPWFFILARSIPRDNIMQLMGITDTSMLRPQVFALQEGEEQIGLIGSERQAIDEMLHSLSQEDTRFAAKADYYWNARGGSFTDGGSFIFNIVENEGKTRLECMNKFGEMVKSQKIPESTELFQKFVKDTIQLQNLIPENETDTYMSIYELCDAILERCKDSSVEKRKSVDILTLILDRIHLSVYNRNGKARAYVETTLFKIFRSYPKITEVTDSELVLIDNNNKTQLRAPKGHEKGLLIDVIDFDHEGDESAAIYIVKAYHLGWKQVYTFDWHGQRFCGNGLGPDSYGFRIDAYGNPGDYLGSGLDGAEIYVHCAAQDQICNIMNNGKVVIYGDVGQTFMYGAKGGHVFILGNAAGRPLINAVGKPKVVINGTCLDYLAESFMAGDPLKEGGFVIVNGIHFDEEGNIKELDTSYPGGNLFSLASGGAIYIRDPRSLLQDNQLHGGKFVEVTKEDSELLGKFLEENEKLFAIDRELLTKADLKGYRKIIPDKNKDWG